MSRPYRLILPRPLPLHLALLAAAFILSVIPALAQSSLPSNFDVPDSVVLNTKDDYAKYEDVVIDAAKWLEETDLDKEQDKRQRVNAFFVKWITGSPTVNVSIDEPIVRIVDRNPQLLSIYLASYARYVLLNKNAPNTFLATKAGILSVIKVYKKGIGVSRNRQLNKLAGMQEESQIDDYIMDMLHVQKG